MYGNEMSSHVTRAMESETTLGWQPRSAPPRRPGRRRLRRRQILRAYAFIAPSTLIMGLFVLWPLVSSARLSLEKSSGFGPTTFVGLGNYRTVFGDSVFRGDLEHTIVYALVVTPTTVALALLFAVMLNRRMHGRSFFRAALFLPAVLSLGVMSIAWSFLLDPTIGLLPHWLSPLGVSFGQGQANPRIAFVYVSVVGIWKNLGFYMVMYLAGLGTIPQELYEASWVDGATPWRQFRSITWPLLANTSSFVFIMATIASVQAFDQIFTMTRGGPFFSTETLSYLIYRTGFQNFDFGYASAVGWVLTVLVFAISMAQQLFFRRREVTY
jgi:ABC-type sugar transport system permease subunit